MISPSSIRVAQRVVILYTLMFRFTAENNPNHPKTKDWLAILPQWLDRLNLGSELEPLDAEIIGTELGGLDQERLTDARGCGEAIGVLGWALQRVAVPPDFEPVDPNLVFPALGLQPVGMVKGAEELIACANLRPREEILAYYAQNEIVHCCMRSREMSAGNSATMQQITRKNLAVLKLERGESDFRSAQERVARLTGEQFRRLAGICFVRSFAAEWLVGKRECYWGDEEEEEDDA